MSKKQKNGGIILATIGIAGGLLFSFVVGGPSATSASAAAKNQNYVTAEPTLVKAKQKIAVGYAVNGNKKKKVYVKKGTILRVNPDKNAKGIPTFSFDANTLSSKQLSNKTVDATNVVTAKKKYFSVVKPKKNNINGWQFRNTGATVTISDFEESQQSPTYSITSDGKSLKFDNDNEISEHQIVKMTKKGATYTIIYKTKLPDVKNIKNTKIKKTYKLTIQNKAKKIYPYKNISADQLAQILDSGYSVSAADKKMAVYQYKINGKFMYTRRALAQHGYFV